MPKFYCSHCGQHIDAPDELAGTNAICPSCEGRIEVPLLPLTDNSIKEISSQKPPLKYKTSVREKKHIKSSIWESQPMKYSLGALVICLVAVLARPASALEQMGFSQKNGPKIMGETLGRFLSTSIIALIISLAIAGILVAYKKRFKDSLSKCYSITIIVVAFLSLLTSIIAKNSSSLSYDREAKDAKDARNALADIEEDINTLISETRDPEGIPKKTDLRFDTNKKQTNDMQKIRVLFKAFFNDMITLQNEYIEALGNDGIDRLLNADRISKDNGFFESRRIIRDAKVTVKNTRNKASLILSDFPKRIKNYQFTDASDQQILKGYQKGLDKALPLFMEIWDLEAKTLAHYEDLIDHLEAKKQLWSADEGQFIFEREVDMNRFDLIISRVVACVDRQTEIREKSLQNATQKFKDLKDKLPK